MTRWIGVLDGLGRRARWMLLGLRVLQGLGAVVLAGLALGVLDWLLVLPGWLRLGLGAGAAAFGVWWAATRLRRAWGLRLSRGELALRVERLEPAARGWLAAAVELSEGRSAKGEGRSGSGGGGELGMAGAVVAKAEGMVGEVRAGRVLDGSRLWRAGGVLLAGVMVVGGIGWASPGSVATATQRWVLPLGDAAWPRRQAVVDATEDRVWASDAAVVLGARVTKGDRAGLSVSARVAGDGRGGGSGGGGSVVALTRQGVGDEGEGVYEALVEVPGWVRGRLAGEPGAVVSVGYGLEAGDAAVGGQRLRVAQRPEVVAVGAEVVVPEYAAGWVTGTTAAWEAGTGGVSGLGVEGLAGSEVLVTVTASKPMEAGSWAASLAGLGEDVVAGGAVSEDGRVGGGGGGGGRRGCRWWIGTGFGAASRWGLRWGRWWIARLRRW
ncbi:MAG: hypothetical protein AAF078_08040 [Planctomycetota bacterium]